MGLVLAALVVGAAGWLYFFANLFSLDTDDFLSGLTVFVVCLFIAVAILGAAAGAHVATATP